MFVTKNLENLFNFMVSSRSYSKDITILLLPFVVQNVILILHVISVVVLSVFNKYL